MTFNKRTTAFMVLVSMALTSQAHADDIPIIQILDGVTTDGASPRIFVFEETDPTHEWFEINWDFTIDSISPSWGSELGITVAAPDGSSWTLGTDGNACGVCDFNFGFTDTSGLFSSDGSLDIAGSYGLGTWSITIFESFDDAGIDGQFLQGVLWITATHSQPVPEPASLWLLGSGLVALGALRRRRRAAA